MAASRRWVRDFSPAMLEEIDAALRGVQRRGLAWHGVTRDAFPLPLTASVLAETAEELENGSGMMKLRGLPVARYSEDELRDHLVRPRRQPRPAGLTRTAAAS